jgi:MFS transporter, DHA3 family, macrolide efflux protein
MRNPTSTTTHAPSLRPFALIWGGQAVSLLGSQLVQFALVWWLTRTTGSATVLALATLVALLPQIVLGPVAGALVDRWSRRWVMVVADSVTALATLGLAALFLLHKGGVVSIYALLLVRATGAAFQWPAMQASTTLMVPAKHLGRVGGLNQALGGAAAILIPPLGALAVEALPLQAVLAIDVLTALPAIVSLLCIAVPQPARTQPTGTGLPAVWADMQVGLRWVLARKPILAYAAVCVLINVFGRAAGALFPLLVTRHFQGGAAQLGWMQSSVGVGAVLGGALLGVWGGPRRRVAAGMALLAVDGLAVMLVGFSPREAFGLAVGAVFVAGFLESLILGLGGAAFQVIVPPEVQGRVFGLLGSAAQALAPLGLLVAGPTADALGVPFWVVLTGCAFVLLGVGSLLVPAIVHLDDPAPQPASATPTLDGAPV